MAISNFRFRNLLRRRLLAGGGARLDMNPGSAAHRHTTRRERRALPARLLCVTLLAGLGAPAAAAAQPPAARTAWGDPDLRGLWNHGTATPLERPERHGGGTG